ncbi:MAG: ASCH domain-containing protein [Treponema sp.]|nr:ASCH domain-containing protein [Candidatus Treponema merdequi]
MTCDEFWIKYKKETNQNENLKYNGEFSFGFDEKSITEMNSLVLAGLKKIMVTPLETYSIDNSPVPRTGNHYVITGINEEPVCIIRDVDVSVMAFKDVTWQIAKKDGEASSIEEWRENHKEYLEEEAEIVGFEFSENTPVVIEEFEVIYKA